MAKTTGIDASGFIHTVAHVPLQADFLAVIEDLRSMLLRPLVHRIDSAYLYGSIARGEAIPGRSDLDVVLILAGKTALQDELDIEAARRALESGHPEVSKVDFDVGILEEVQAPENRHRWGFWLKHHCRCIHGHDLARDIEPFRPSRTIARAVNGDFHEVLEGYARRITTESDVSAVARFAREASRKLIRATNILRPVASNRWPESLEDHIVLFLDTYPQMVQEVAFFHCFAALSGNEPSQVVPTVFVDRLRAFSAWMQREL